MMCQKYHIECLIKSNNWNLISPKSNFISWMKRASIFIFHRGGNFQISSCVSEKELRMRRKIMFSFFMFKTRWNRFFSFKTEVFLGLTFFSSFSWREGKFFLKKTLAEFSGTKRLKKAFPHIHAIFYPRHMRT